jgi:biopolymer transport protein ExbD
VRQNLYLLYGFIQIMNLNKKETMAQIQLQPARTGTRNSIHRSHIRIDMTPMVDLGFLLITFFIFTSSMSDSRATDLYVPAGDQISSNVGESTALTVLLTGGDSIYYYHGNLEDAVKDKAVLQSNFDVQNGIGDVIRNKQRALGKEAADLVVMIKPTERSTYNKLMNVLDEILINQVKRYAIMDVTKTEQAFLDK